MNNISRYIIGFITLLLVGLSFYYLGDIYAYIIVAWVVSMIGTPLVSFLRKFMSKGLAAGITIFSFVLGFGLILWLLVPPVLKQVNHLTEIDFDKVIKNVEEPLEDWNIWLKEKGFYLNKENKEIVGSNDNKLAEILDQNIIKYDTLIQNDGIDSISQEITIILQVDNHSSKDSGESMIEDNNPTILLKAREYLINMLNPKNIPNMFGSVFGLAGTILVYTLAIIFLGFFFLKEQGLFGRMITMWVPDKHNIKVYRAIDQTSSLLVRYFIGVTIQVTIITIYVSVLLSLFGVENALMIGFLVGLVNVIPFVGPIIGWVFGLVIILSSSIDLSFYQDILPKIGVLTGVIGSMQLLDNIVLQPNIFSRSIKAHPVEIFLVILIAAKLGGIFGMVLAIPFYTVFRVVTKEFLGRFEVLSKVAKGLNDN